MPTKNFKQTLLDTVAEFDALLDATDIYTSMCIFFVGFKPSELDHVAELETFLEATDMYTSRHTCFCWTSSLPNWISGGDMA